MRTARRPRLPRGLRAVALAAAVAAVLAACGGGEGSAGTPAGTAAARGGRLVALMPTEVPGLDPVVAVGSAGGGPMQRMAAIYDALFYTRSDNAKVVPGIGQSLESADGGKTWTLKLRDGVTFTDGTPFDADAVKFNWDRHGDAANGSSWLSLVKAMTYEVVDPLTLKITLNAPNSTFPTVVARSLSYIGSPTAIKAEGKDFNLKPVGAGPFKLQSWTQDSEMDLVRNPAYWNKDRPALDELVFKVITDDQQRADAFNAGEGDLAFEGDPTKILALQQAGAQITQFQQFGGIGLEFNLTEKKWQDPRARQAIAKALDRAQYNQVTYQGALDDPKTLFRPGTPYSDPSLALPAYDLAGAQRLIDAYLRDTGQSELRFTFNVVAASASQQAAELMQAQLSKLRGVHMDINLVNAQQLVASLVQKTFDTTQFSFRGAGPEPEFSEGFRTGGSRNVGSYSNPTVDTALAAVRATTDEATQKAEYLKVGKQLLTDMPFVMLTRDVIAVAYSKNVRGVELFEDGGLFTDRVSIAS